MSVDRIAQQFYATFGSMRIVAILS